jgi:hypothetical protein
MTDINDRELGFSFASFVRARLMTSHDYVVYSYFT